MNSNTVYFYVFDTMADWEIGFLTAELNSGRFFKKGTLPVKVVTVGLDRNPITTMGGLRILPDIELKECAIKEGDCLVLSGGETWLEPFHQPILGLVKECLEKQILVAAICGATFSLAQQGILDTRNHTSNDLGYLKMVSPNYTGESYYQNTPAVRDGNLITASGTSPLEFTAQVLKTLNVFSEETLDAWYRLYKTQGSDCFYQLMKSLQ